MLSLNHHRSKFVVVFSENIPVQIQNGEKSRVVLLRNDLRTSHEEADLTIIRQLVSVSDSGMTNIRVICEDTDVFVLLVFCVSRLKNESCVTMESFVSNQTIIDINKTIKMNEDINTSLTAAHALSGCDSMSQIF